MRWLLWSRSNQEEIQGALCSFTALDYYNLLPDNSGVTHLAVPENLRKRGSDDTLRLHYQLEGESEEALICGPWRIIHPAVVIENLHTQLTERGVYEQVLREARDRGMTSPSFQPLPPVITFCAKVTEDSLPRGQSLFSGNSLTGFGSPDGSFAMNAGDERMNENSRILSALRSISQRERPIRIPTSFTLVEMLVVISIISLLCAMLMPSLMKAMGSAKTVMCYNNLRCLGAALNQYADDYADWMPPATISNYGTYNGASFNRSWYQASGYFADPYLDIRWSTGDYLKGTVFDCPEQSCGVGQMSEDYTYNQCLGNQATLQHTRIIHRRKDVKRPAKLIALADVMGAQLTGSYGQNLAVFEAWGFDWFTTFHFRHLDKVSVLAVDQHVSSAFFSDISLNDTTTLYNTRNP